MLHITKLQARDMMYKGYNYTVILCLFVSIIAYSAIAQTCDKNNQDCKKLPLGECACSSLQKLADEVAKTNSESLDSKTPTTEESEANPQPDDLDENVEESTNLDDKETVEHVEEDSQTPVVEEWADKYKAQANSPFPRTNQMSCLPGGTFTMGSDENYNGEDGEGPARHITLKPFCMDVHEVSIAEFALFVNDTGYQTYAEKTESSFVVKYFLSNETLMANRRFAALDLYWWTSVKNSSWKQPEGPDSNVTNRMDYAAVHIAYDDAVAYCKWAGKRLPTEAEWEYSCRGGLYDKLFPWGNIMQPLNEHRLNTWTGKFPTENTAEDGYASFAPVTAFLSQNKYGLKNIVGNAWEWVADYWDTDFSLYPEENPTGAPKGIERVKKGGSFLCSIGYCYRYRCAARSSNYPTTTAYNLGFRCASDKLPEYIPPFDVKAVLKTDEEMRKAGNVTKSPDDWEEKVERAHTNANPGHS